MAFQKLLASTPSPTLPVTGIWGVSRHTKDWVIGLLLLHLLHAPVFLCVFKLSTFYPPFALGPLADAVFPRFWPDWLPLLIQVFTQLLLQGGLLWSPSLEKHLPTASTPSPAHPSS